MWKNASVFLLAGDKKTGIILEHTRKIGYNEEQRAAAEAGAVPEAPALDVGTCILTASYAAAETGETVNASGEIAAPAEGCSGGVV